MRNKIIGISILIIGIIMISGILYYFFADYFGLPGFTDLFKTKKEIPEVSRENQEKTVNEEVGEKPAAEKSQAIETIRVNPVTTELNLNSTVVEPEEIGKEELIRLAESFAERFGSYSNQSNFSNIKSLKIFMSQHMREWSENYIKEQLASGSDNSIYYGITTKSISSEIIDYDDDLGNARIRVQTRRREATSSTNNLSNVFAQDVIINLIKEKGAWKVDSANWQN